MSAELVEIPVKVEVEIFHFFPDGSGRCLTSGENLSPTEVSCFKERAEADPLDPVIAEALTRVATVVRREKPSVTLGIIRDALK